MLNRNCWFIQSPCLPSTQSLLSVCGIYLFVIAFRTKLNSVVLRLCWCARGKICKKPTTTQKDNLAHHLAMSSRQADVAREGFRMWPPTGQVDVAKNEFGTNIIPVASNSRTTHVGTTTTHVRDHICKNCNLCNAHWQSNKIVCVSNVIFTPDESMTDVFDTKTINKNKSICLFVRLIWHCKLDCVTTSIKITLLTENEWSSWL